MARCQLLLLGLLLQGAVAAQSWMAAEAGELPVAAHQGEWRPVADGPVIGYRLLPFLRVSPGAEAGRLDLRLVLPLEVLVEDFGRYVATQLPNDPCARNRAENWVLRLDQLTADAVDGTLHLRMQGHFELWACVRERYIGRLQHSIAEGGFEVLMPLHVDTVDEHFFRLRLGTPELQLQVDSERRSTQRWLRLLEMELAERLQSRLAAKDQGEWLIALPELAQQLDAKALSLEALAAGDSVALQARISATVSWSAARRLLGALGIPMLQ